MYLSPRISYNPSVLHTLRKGFHTTYGNITTTADEVEEEAEPATNDEIVPEEAEAEILADSAAFSNNNNVLAAGTMAMGFAAALFF